MYKEKDDNYKDCKVRDLYYNPLNKEDEELIKNHVKSKKMQFVVSIIFIILMLYVAVAGWFSGNVDLKIKLFLTGIGGLWAWLFYKFLMPKVYVAEGVVHGTIVTCHHETHRSSNNKRAYNTYYAQVVFDSINRRVISMEVPCIQEKVSTGVTIDKSPEPGTEIVIYKIKNNHYTIIYPEYYNRHMEFHIAG